MASYGMFAMEIKSESRDFIEKYSIDIGSDIMEAEFRLRRIATDYHQGFELWEIDQNRKVEETIIVVIKSNNQKEYRTFPEYLVKETMLAYYSPELKLLLIEGTIEKRNFAYKMMRKISGIDVEKIIIDIKSLVNSVPRVDRVNIERGSSVSANKVILLGSGVNQDILYDQLIDEDSDIVSTKIIFNYNGTDHKINVSKNGGVYIMGKYEDANLKFEVLNEFYKYLKENGFIIY